MTATENSTKSQAFFRPLAIACLRAPFDPDAAEQARFELLAPNFDWSAFVDFLHKERISLLVYFYWKEKGIFPPSVETNLKRLYFQSAWTNDLRMEELGIIITGLRDEGISSIILKGAALVHTIYEKSALRPMCDIDLLVKPEDMERTQQTLSDCGFNTLFKSPMPEEFENEVSIYKQGQHMWKVDLHSSLLGAPHNLTHEQMHWFWQNRVLAARNGREIGILGPEAQLLHLCAHLWLHHGGSDLLGMNDIYLLLVKNQDRINWDEVLSIGENFELVLPLQHVLREMATEWKVPVPEYVIAKLSCLVPSSREKRKFNKFLGDGQDYFSTLGGTVLSYRDWKTGIRFAWAIAFPPVHYMKDKFHVKSNWQIPYFYAYRIFSRILKQTARMVRKSFPVG